MKLTLWLLALIFSPSVDATGSRIFRERERGSTLLAACWPLSEPALQVGRGSSDMEVRRRCERATPKTWRADWAAAGIVARHTERDGLPLMPFDFVLSVETWELRAGVMRIAEAHGISTADSYYFGESAFWQHPTGYDYVRLKLRGLDVGGADSWSREGRPKLVAEWAARKGRP